MALVWGDPDRGTIEQPLGRHPVDRIKFVVREDGKRALTHYVSLDSGIPAKSGSGGMISLVQCQLETGRTHQIRVHAASLGCPILGDDRYGDRMMNTRYKQRYAGSLCLHAAAIELAVMNDITLRGICVPLSESWHNLLEAKTAAS